MLELRPYRSEDREALLAVFDSNVPEFLHTDERAGFEVWLDGPQGTFLALEVAGEVVGCGGWVVDDGTLRLTWGLLRADRHGEGLGDLQLVERLVRGFAATAVRTSTLGTTPKVEPFFARLGFERTGFRADGWGPGLDRVDMRLEHDERARSALAERRAALWTRQGAAIPS